MAAEDPLSWDRQVRTLAEFEELFAMRLKQDPEGADSSGPFVGIAAMTERQAFAEVRAMPVDLPIRRPLLRWMYRLADARVNAGMRLALARFWRSERLDIESLKEANLTRAGLLLRALANTSARAHFWGGLQKALADQPSPVSELWQRREELAKRAGFDSVRAVFDPIDDFAALREQWQTLSEPSAAEFLPREPLRLLSLAMSERANSGWPARITAHSMAALLGEKTWLRLAHVKQPHWPALAGPASYARALGSLGESLAQAWASPSYPFVLTNDPWKLERHTMSALLASLTLNESWHARVLDLGRDQARTQVRAFAESALFMSRLFCFRVALRAAVAHASQALQPAFAELSYSLFGFELPPAMAGFVPRIGRSDAQRLLGFWAGLATHVRWIREFDEDWYRNPKAIEALRGQALERPNETFTGDQASEAQTVALRFLKSSLER